MHGEVGQRHNLLPNDLNMELLFANFNVNAFEHWNTQPNTILHLLFDSIYDDYLKIEIVYRDMSNAWVEKAFIATKLMVHWCKNVKLNL